MSTMENFLTMVEDINNGGVFQKIEAMHQGEHDAGGLGICTGDPGIDAAYDKGFYKGQTPKPSHQGEIMNPDEGPAAYTNAWLEEKIRILFGGREKDLDLPDDEYEPGFGGSPNMVVNGNYAD